MIYDTILPRRWPGNKVGNAGKNYPVDELLNSFTAAW